MTFCGKIGTGSSFSTTDIVFKYNNSLGLGSNPRDLLSVPGLSICDFLCKKLALGLVFIRLVLFSNITLLWDWDRIRGTYFRFLVFQFVTFCVKNWHWV